jgi:hypothetical protein
LLYQLEGQTLRFEEKREDGTVKEHVGKLIRSGYVPGGGSEQPIVEEEGAVRFSLPGQPVFEGIDPNAFLKPSLVWQLAAKKAGECPIEVAYVTAGMSWEATYSLVAPAEGSDEFDLSGWISLQQQHRQDVRERRHQADRRRRAEGAAAGTTGRKVPKRVAFAGGRSRVRHARRARLRRIPSLHLPRPVLLRNNELKQVEFIRATGVKGNRYYVYNPLVGFGYYGGGINTDPDYGGTADKKVGVRIEISNSETNRLGVPLPKGRLRLYRADSKDGRREFTGENQMDHLPKNELLKLDMGNAFDLVGERKRMDFKVDTTGKKMSESFEIKLRNRKETDAVEIRVVEPLYRGANWKIAVSSLPFAKSIPRRSNSARRCRRTARRS